MSKIVSILLLLLISLLTACDPAPLAARRSITSFLNQAEAFLAEQNYTEATSVLEEAAQTHTEDPQPLIKLGQIYLLQHQWLPAEDAFNRALARDLKDPSATAGLAEVKLQQGDLSKALSLWQTAASLEPALPGVFTGLGRTHIMRFEFEQAREAFLAQQQQQLDPEAQWHLATLEAPSNITMANNYLLSIPEDASADVLSRRDYLIAVLVPFTVESTPAEIGQAEGIAFVQVGYWPLAVYALTTAGQYSGQTDQEKAETLAFLGHALAQAGRPALDLFERAAALDSTSALPLFFYGIYLRQQGALKAAEETFSQAITLDPDNAAIYIELAQMEMERGNFTTAEVYYLAAARIAEDDPHIQLLRVQFYANRGYRLTEAGIPAAEKLIEADKNNAEAYDLLGWMQFLSGQGSEAETNLRKAIELDPNLISAHYHLARFLEVKGDIAAGVDAYRYVVEQDRSGIFRTHAAQALQRLEQPQ